MSDERKSVSSDYAQGYDDGLKAERALFSETMAKIAGFEDTNPVEVATHFNLIHNLLAELLDDEKIPDEIKIRIRQYRFWR